VTSSFPFQQGKFYQEWHPQWFSVDDGNALNIAADQKKGSVHDLPNHALESAFRRAIENC